MCASVNSSGPDQVDISECGNLTEEYAMVSRQSRIYAMVVIWSYGQKFIYAMVSIWSRMYARKLYFYQRS